jgi:hypothetical protein
MAGLEEAVRVLGDVSRTRHRRCLAAEAIVMRTAVESATPDSASVYEEGDIATLAREILAWKVLA